MPEIRELLQQAAQQPTRRPSVDDMWRRGKQLRSRRRAISAALASACVIAFAGALVLIADGADRQTLDVIAPPEIAPQTTPTRTPTSASSTASSATTTIGTLTNAVSGTAHPFDQVTVVVMNGSGMCGVATNYRPFVAANGYRTVPSENAPTAPVSTSTVVFIDGFGPDATVLATRLHMPIAPTVDARTTALLDKVGANIGVILGQDALTYVAKPDQCGTTGELATTGTVSRPCVTWVAGRADGSEERGSTC